jgi:hypothetical protein
VWISLCFSHQILKFDKRSGRPLEDRIGAQGEGEGKGQLYFPSTLAVDDLYLYVQEWGNNRVQIFKKLTHELVGTITSTSMQVKERKWQMGLDTFDSCVWVISDGLLQSFAV